MLTIFIFWVSILPLIVWNGAYEGPKVFWFLGGGIILTFFWIYKILFKKEYFEFSKADLLYFLWLFVLLIASIFGVHPFESIIGGSYRHQGVIFFLLLWLTGKTAGILDGKKKKLLYKAVGFAVVAECLIVFYQLISGTLYLGKPLGTLGETNAVAGMIAIGSYFVFTTYPKIYSLLLISIIFTESRSGILAFLPNLGIMIGSLGRRLRNFLIALLILSSVFLLLYFSLIKSNLPYDTFESRQIIWPAAIQEIVKRPVLGYGAESGEVVFYDRFKLSGIYLTGLAIDRAHNIYLDVTMWSGITGLFLFSGWLFLSYRGLKDNGRKLAFWAFLIYSFFQPLSVVHWLLLILLL